MQTDSPTSVMVTDLDNTLWDWFAMWHAGFSALLDGLVAESGVKQSTLEAEIRVLHQANGTSEYAPELLIPSLPSLRDGSERDSLLARYDGAIHAFHKARKESLKLYPGVLDTILTLRDSGVLIVAYTESQAFVTSQRMLRTGLDGLIDYLYSPPDHDLPDDVSREDLRRYDPDHYRLELTKHLNTPLGAKKPSEMVLRSILDDLDVDPVVTLYVGDSRMKDVVMAQAVGVRDVWAKYGEVQEHSGYPLLRRVSHWPDDDVENEKRVDTENSVHPSYTLAKGLHELREQFTFSRWRQLTSQELDRAQVVWQQTIQVQEHFNDLEMRIRNFALTMLVALLGATGVVLQRGNKTLAALLVVGALVAWGAFYLMDRWWYHPLLRGAVGHAIKLEKRLAPQIPGIRLTAAIGDASHTLIRGKVRDSTTKMRWFYGLIGAVLGIILLVIILVPVEASDQQGKSPTPTATTQQP